VVVILAASVQAQRPRGTDGAQAPLAPLPAADARTTKLKELVSAEIKAQPMYDLGQQMNDMVFSYGELGFQEFETQRYLGKVLRDNGFTVEEGVAGIPSAWVARWGSGHPIIAFGSDVDCIPQASQKPGVAYRDPIVEGAPGHGEGHNSGTPLNIVAAISVKRVMERQKIPGTLMIWPGIAEELLGSKAYFVRAGLFKDVDAVLYNHIGSNLGTSWGDGGGSGLVSVEYIFEGETAHSGAAPWRGRSALDAVELMDVGWNYRREHLRLSQRSHNIVSNGGDQPNVVPRNAATWYYFRETDRVADDQHDVDGAGARLGVAASYQSPGRAGNAGQHRAGRAAGMERSGRDACRSVTA
jgi:aminobenzoyl-glutamate utilization protein B